jgi:hypothetical membrane protein
VEEKMNSLPSAQHLIALVRSPAFFGTIAVAYLVLILIAAHLAAPAAYSWKVHSISELAAQNYRNAWIMRAGFIGFGLLLAAASLVDILTHARHWVYSTPVMIYGLAILMTGFFSTAPFQPGTFSVTESGIHSLFARIAGFALIAAMIGNLVTAENWTARILDVAGILAVTLFSILFGTIPEIRGVFQRLLWLGGIAWIFFTYLRS